MGIICELYCLENYIVSELIQNPKEFEEYILENYTNPDGQNHIEGESFFYLDKAWDIAMFLLRENDYSIEKLLLKLEGEPINKDMEGFSIINSDDVKLINQILINISENEIERAYDINKMKEAEIYRAGWFTKNNNWDYIMEHVKKIREAFLIASKKNLTIILSKG